MWEAFRSQPADRERMNMRSSIARRMGSSAGPSSRTHESRWRYRARWKLVFCAGSPDNPRIHHLWSSSVKEDSPQDRNRKLNEDEQDFTKGAQLCYRYLPAHE